MQQLRESIVTRLRARGTDIYEVGGGVAFNDLATNVPLCISIRISDSSAIAGQPLLTISATTPRAAGDERPASLSQVRRDGEAPRGPADPPIEFSGPTPWPTARQREVKVLLNMINATRLRTGALSLSSVGNVIRFDWTVPVAPSGDLAIVDCLIEIAQSVVNGFLPVIEGVVVEGFSAETALRRRAPNASFPAILDDA